MQLFASWRESLKESQEKLFFTYVDVFMQHLVFEHYHSPHAPRQITYNAHGLIINNTLSPAQCVIPIYNLNYEAILHFINWKMCIKLSIRSENQYCSAATDIKLQKIVLISDSLFTWSNPYVHSPNWYPKGPSMPFRPCLASPLAIPIDHMDQIQG